MYTAAPKPLKQIFRADSRQAVQKSVLITTRTFFIPFKDAR